MFDLAAIKLTSERNKKALELRPSLSKSTDTAKARIADDLRCNIDASGWKISVDMPEYYGGKGTTPGPGEHALSSLISCLALGYVIRFAEMSLPLAGLQIEVHADYDSAVTPEYTDVRCVVTVESDAPEDEILRALDEADAKSFGLAMFKRPVNTRREVRITAPTS